MPTHTREVKEKLIMLDYLSDRPSIYGEFVTSRSTVDKPSSSKRVKPIDLFANGTERMVRSTESHVVDGASMVSGSGSWTGTYWDYKVEPYPVEYFGPSMLSTARDACDTQTLLKIKDQKVNLSVSIAELGKTTDMVADLARDTFRFFRSLRKGEFKRMLRILKSSRTYVEDDLASKWLKYQYGIIPTMMEVNGLSEFIYRQIKEGYIRGSHTTRTHFTSGIKRNTSYFSSVNPRFGVYYRKNTYRYRVSSEGLRSLSQSGITNPAAFVYELIPYSFVLDWIFPIGDYLATLDALVGIEDLLVIRSDTLHQTDMNHYVPPWMGSPTKMTVGLSISHTRRTRRLSPTSTLKPGFPRYAPHVSTTRMISGLALLNNFLSQKRM